jgi:DNA-binding transcriptional ArsR family regulator
LGASWATGRNDAITRIQRAKVAWLCVRMQLAYVGITRSLVGGDLISSLLLPAIVDANVGHLDADPDISRRHQALDAAYPDELRRPANALSIAQFLEIPRETARAKLTAMVANGVLHRTPAGYILPTATLISDRFLPAIPRYLDALDDFVRGLGLIRAFGLKPDSRLAHPVWPVAWAAMRLSTAHVLRETAYTRELTSGMGLTACYVLLTVCHSAGGQLRLPSQMPARGGALSVLGPTFGPVRGSVAAARLGLPEETVRRHLRQLVEAGYLCRGPRGYDVVHDANSVPVWRMFQKRAQANARQLVWRLTTTGVVPTAD